MHRHQLRQPDVPQKSQPPFGQISTPDVRPRPPFGSVAAMQPGPTQPDARDGAAQLCGHACARASPMQLPVAHSSGFVDTIAVDVEPQGWTGHRRLAEIRTAPQPTPGHHSHPLVGQGLNAEIRPRSPVGSAPSWQLLPGHSDAPATTTQLLPPGHSASTCVCRQPGTPQSVCSADAAPFNAISIATLARIIFNFRICPPFRQGHPARIRHGGEEREITTSIDGRRLGTAGPTALTGA